MRRIKKTKYYSKCIGQLPDGCKRCVEGKKLVLFVTGLCYSTCPYCPLSASRKGKDFIWANEWKILKDEEILEEARLCKAKGAGITGGDPLIKLDRTLKYIEMLKKEFGEDFHIHLYAPLKNVSASKLQMLFDAGLDEIRFHPNLDKRTDWNKIRSAKKFDWDIGIEIPAIPGKEKQTKNLVNYMKKYIDFLNINELEISETNFEYMQKNNLETKGKGSYAIKGSEELAQEILKFCRKLKFNVHYCSCRLKDKVQLTKRIKRRAKNVAKPYDVITKDGTLIRGAIYLPDLVPSFGYSFKLVTINNPKEHLDKLRELRKDLKRDLKVPDELLEVDKKKIRLLIAPWILDKLHKRIHYPCAIVEEYPTWDGLEVRVDFY